MFGIGMPELILILCIALMVIGPKKLPDLAKSLGRAMGEFKKATSELKESINAEADFKEVRDSFNSVKDDLKTTVNAKMDEYMKEEATEGETGDVSDKDTDRDAEPRDEASQSSSLNSESVGPETSAQGPDEKTSTTT